MQECLTLQGAGVLDVAGCLSVGRCRVSSSEWLGTGVLDVAGCMTVDVAGYRSVGRGWVHDC